jgi:hypothetical protein
VNSGRLADALSNDPPPRSKLLLLEASVPRILLCAFFLCGCGSTLAAQSVVVIQNNQQIRSGAIGESIRAREQEYWAERVGFKITKNNDYELYAVLRGLGAAAKNNDGTQLDSKTLTQIGLDSLNYYNDPTALPKLAGQDSATNSVIAAGSMDNPWIGVAAPVVLDMMSANLSDQLSALYPVDRDDLRSRFLNEGTDGLRDLWAQADKDPRLKAAINEVIAKRYKGISLDDNVVTTPDIDLQTYKAMVGSLGNQSISPQDLKDAFKAFEERQNKKLETLDKDLRAFAKSKASQREHENKVKDFRAAIDDERAVFYLASSAAGIVDPTTGKIISGIGTAYTKIAEASGLYRLGEISSLRLTADVVSAGLLLTSMLGNSGPTADEIILQEIHQLSLQIDSFRQEMHARFDRVDQSLSRMYVDLIANFNEVNKNVAQARQGIVALQVQLINLQGQLGELDRRVQSYTQGLSSQVSSNDQLLCIPETGEGIQKSLNDEQALACELSFANGGSAIAKSTVWNNLSTDYSDDVLETQLNRPIEENVNFLWGLAAMRFGLRPARSFTVANPVVWAGNSNKYARLVSISRPISTHLGPTDELIATGNEINAVIKALGQSEVNGTQKIFFDELFPYFVYQINKTELDAAALEMAYRRQMMAGYDAWGDTEQQKDTSSQDKWTFATAPQATPLDMLASLNPCTDAKDVLSGAALVAPNKLVSWIPYSFRMAHELGVGRVNACYSSVHWVRYVQKGDTWNGSLVLDIKLTFAPTPPAAKSQKKAGGKARSNPLPSQPKELVVAWRSATSSNWMFDCGTERTSGAFGNVSVAACNTRHAKGFTAQETATALQQLWPNWQNTYVGSASNELNPADEVAKHLKTVRNKVETSLANHRATLRREVVEAIDGQTGNPDFVAEERTSVIKSFHIMRGIKSVIDAYAGLVLSHSIETNETFAAGLGGISPDNWAVEIIRTGKKRTRSPQIVEGVSRVLYPLGLGARANNLQALFHKGLASGAEPYTLIETTLQNLRAVRVVQIAQSLSTTHPCFATGSNAVVEGGSETGADQTLSYADEDALTSIRIRVIPKDKSPTTTKTDIVVGNGDLLMSALSDGKGRDPDGNISVTLPANGMVLGTLRNGSVRVCNQFAAATHHWEATAVEVEISKGNDKFEVFRRWTNVAFPPGMLSSVTFRRDHKIAVQPSVEPRTDASFW